MGRRNLESAESCGFAVNYLDSKYADMKCPALPDHGANNFWLLSCQTKQQMPEHRKTCYPHCKKVREGLSAAEQQESKHHDIVKAEAAKVRKSILSLFDKGLSQEQIAKQVERHIMTVGKYLRNEGLLKRKQNTLRQKILIYLAKHPDTSYIDLMAKFDCKKGTAQAYKTEYNKGYRAIKVEVKA